jgi:phage terminase small subunit
LLTKQWVIDTLIQNVQRAMQAEAVTDREGVETGEFTYNGAVANRALELLGKEVGMFNDRREIGNAGAFANLTAEQVDEAIAALEAATRLDAVKPAPATVQDETGKVSSVH